ncbi:MAG TPA: DUF389 domain-containing protein [Saprospiraceae bacterium]|nr:DUF389 domain-containing protein [Saprospiraceae bacterium]HMP25789.1 DUF389 domain-containing protein [Saprospiraceae bacterium]
MLRTILYYFSLEKEVEDYDTIHAAIEKDIIFKGTNLWILVFAIIVASVGLNMNSTAVIIGAMLISPLMGPINGMGYSVATYNFPLFRKAVKNFSFAVGASLAASALYFAISPVSTAHSELLARTSPTIYDVLIALFGGLAGIVAISSKQKGNVIPGVAIATALMPPLCTAGYGLATGQFPYFFGAIYLFTINTVFIAISSIVISQILKFPIRTIVEEGQKKRVNRWISLIIAITVIPSIYFGYGLVQQEQFTENATRYTRNVTAFEGSYLLRQEINARRKTITLIYGGNSLSEAHKATIRAKAEDFSLRKADIIIEQGFAFADITSNLSEMDKLKGEISRLNQVLNDKQRQQDSLAQRALMGRQLLQELQTLYPQVKACSYAESAVFRDTVPTPERTALIILEAPPRSLKTADKEKINSWLQSRLNTKAVRAYFDE